MLFGMVRARLISKSLYCLYQFWLKKYSVKINIAVYYDFYMLPGIEV